MHGYLLDHLCMKSLVDYEAESLELQCQKHCIYKPKFESLYWLDEVFTKSQCAISCVSSSKKNLIGRFVLLHGAESSLILGL